MINDRKTRPLALQGGLAAAFTTMNEAEAVRVAQSYYGIEGRATRFATEKDDTFRITAMDGTRFVLKAANPAEQLAELDLQLKLLHHLAVTAPSLPVPRVVTNMAGEDQFRYLDDAGQQRQIRMMTYLEGQPLSEVDSTRSGRQEVGKALARLRLAMADFKHPADSRVIAWDVKHLLTLECFLDEIADPGRRRQLAAGMARFAAIQPLLMASRMQVLHNDFSKSNIVVDQALPTFVSGVIDFGDAVRTSVAIDVSTAMLNQLPRERQDHGFLAHSRDLLEGYLSVAELTDGELGLIPHLVMSRVVARALLSTSLANAVPENATYLLRNTEQGWHQLDWFLKRSEAEVSDLLINANATPQS